LGLREGDNLADLCIGGRTILKWIFKKWVGEGRTGFIWLRTGNGECGNEPSGFVNYGEFLD
jgi:hypothetical protein